MRRDPELLRAFSRQADEPAFAELVARHLPLVYGVAVRVLGGDAHAAQDVAQTVFTALARKARSLEDRDSLAGWLHTVAHHAAVQRVRSETRRRQREERADLMSDEVSEQGIDWDQLRPVIDETLETLSERDRTAVLLRFFAGLSFAEVGQRLALSEDAARMRVDRALTKLEVALTRRGITSTSAALGVALAALPASAAPAGLATAVTSSALAAASAGGTTGIVSIFLMSKFTAPVVCAALAAGLTTLVWNSVAQDLRPELATLRQENARLTQATADGASPAALAAVAEEFAAQASAISHAVGRRHATSGASPAGGAQPKAGGGATLTKEAGSHRNHGQATAHDAWLSFAWAGSVGDVGELAKLVYFDGNGRTKALAVLASMPESIRAEYSTPEELYGFFLAVHAILGPPPGEDVLERFTAVELRPGRTAIRAPGASDNYHEYQETPDGWKWVIVEPLVDLMPQVLNNETVAKLGTP